MNWESRPLQFLKERLSAYVYMLYGPDMIQKGFDQVLTP